MSGVDTTTPVTAELPAPSKPALTPEEAEAKRLAQKRRREEGRAQRDLDKAQLAESRRRTLEAYRAETEEKREDALVELCLQWNKLRSLYATAKDIGHALFLNDPKLERLLIKDGDEVFEMKK
jgi:hypothetical protein